MSLNGTHRGVLLLDVEFKHEDTLRAVVRALRTYFTELGIEKTVKLVTMSEGLSADELLQALRERDQLVYQVETRVPNQTRFETALKLLAQGEVSAQGEVQTNDAS